METESIPMNRITKVKTNSQTNLGFKYEAENESW